MKRVLTFALGCLLLGSCGIYKKYESKSQIPADVYGTEAVDSTSNLASVAWQQMFADPCLQGLIATALERSTESKTALLRIQQAEVTYKTARLAYLPTIAFSPTATVSKMGSAGAETFFDLSAQASWELDVFGARTTNSKRKAKANVHFAEDYDQAVRCRLISTVASLYYELLSLDRQVAIQRQMIALYEKTYESMQALYDAGVYYSPAVKQTKAQLEQLKVDLIEAENTINSTEHALCQAMDEPFHTIARGDLSAAAMPQQIGTGVPADLLRLRPDVRAAERKIEMAYYDVLLSKGAMYPAISLTADGGWKKLMASELGNPKVWFIQGIGSLVQPIFMGGRLRADLKVSKLEQQVAVEEFRQTVIKAGHEVTTALRKCQMAQQKAPHIDAQVLALQEAVEANQELMNNGTSTYLEVLTSLQELLQAQQSAVANKADGIRALVELYAALGGK